MAGDASGGRTHCALVTEPIDAAALAGLARTDASGALATFSGVVRDHHKGKRVESLLYEAYAPMAERQLERIANDLSENGEVEVLIEHRIGSLNVGDASVVIVAASPHRDTAFAACRQAIERIKVDVPIWKHEFSPDGEHWVGWGGG